jgi:hypothetical protein
MEYKECPGCEQKSLLKTSNYKLCYSCNVKNKRINNTKCPECNKFTLKKGSKYPMCFTCWQEESGLEMCKGCAKYGWDDDTKTCKYCRKDPKLYRDCHTCRRRIVRKEDTFLHCYECNMKKKGIDINVKRYK